MPTSPGRAAATWRRLPVPWVARWSEETVDPRLRIIWTRDRRLAYHEERVTDRAFDVLWYRNRDGRLGVPEFGEIHTGRHLSSMTTPLCQVCGTPARDADGRIPWVIDADEWALLTDPGNPTLTATPPTCRSCWPLATRYCPHLRSTGSTRITVAAARPVRVYGDLYAPTGVLPRETGVLVPFASPVRHHVLGKQLVVELADIRPEPEAGP